MTENSSNMESVKSVLHEMGYVLIDKGTNYRSRPIYRDSDSADVLSIEKIQEDGTTSRRELAAHLRT